MSEVRQVCRNVSNTAYKRPAGSPCQAASLLLQGGHAVEQRRVDAAGAEGLLRRRQRLPAVPQVGSEGGQTQQHLQLPQHSEHSSMHSMAASAPRPRWAASPPPQGCPPVILASYSARSAPITHPSTHPSTLTPAELR